jgi:hypothetical protein
MACTCKQSECNLRYITNKNSNIVFYLLWKIPLQNKEEKIGRPTTRCYIRFQHLFIEGVFTKEKTLVPNLKKCYQMNTDAQIELNTYTVSGINVFDLSSSNEGEIYKCPKGHTIGLNLISEAYVLKNELIANNDFIKSKQKIGVKRGLLRPEPIYFCSQAFRLMVEEEKLSGFEFEVAQIN